MPVWHFTAPVRAANCKPRKYNIPLQRLLDTDELRYPGWCRNGPRAPERKTAVRLFVPRGETAVSDLLQGRFTVDVSAEVGDFVIRRRDGLHAYQLAVVIDDAFQGISAVVRGADLLHSTPRQVILQRMLSLPSPMYAHLPVATDVNGIKLSKSAGAAAIDIARPTVRVVAGVGVSAARAASRTASCRIGDVVGVGNKTLATATCERTASGSNPGRREDGLT